MKKIFKIILICVVALIVIVPLALIVLRTGSKNTMYEIVTVETGDIENTTVATGKVSPRDEVLIKPQISGIISEIRKEAGDYVKNGEVIAVVKVIPEMSSLNSAESRVRVAQINLNLVKTEFERQKQLFGKGVIAKEEMDKSDAEYRKAKEELSNSIDNLDIVKSGMSKATAQYSNTQIRATIDGTILDVPVKVGNSVIQANTFNDGTTIASVANMNDMIFVGKIDETEVGRIHVGMPIQLTVGAIEDKKFEATLEYISPKGVEENGAVLFEFKAAAKIPQGTYIRAGYSANAEIVVAKAASSLVIPESCIEFSGDSAYVYVVKSEQPEQVFEKKHIKTGLSDGVKIEVKSGLKKGDKIRGTEQTSYKRTKKEVEVTVEH
ncbi:HlyD family secretion protein [Dysgonomonas sp. PH5-45]|uniref:efflux RND transporter periplasmic adaptor subunit n=1 Tax=unclassified Dysgonomonas TaxID=2630389 RepID=UPI00247437DD|nr:MULTISPECIES: efflux RND transporter periplasmic adaptor subunit [unclassified Dysgonomonas]MDH6355597.1 HlyD family secretion protein [Dysgonomonas sp. PH5-45]MDH6388493.1 HlyD family secretion protein [Dysgonomonas sp. PH5-37]